MWDELKVGVLGHSNSEKCTCLVIFNEVAVKVRGHLSFQTTRWPNYSPTHRSTPWGTLPQETACMTFALSCKLHQLRVLKATVRFCPRDHGNILSAEPTTNSCAVYFGRIRSHYTHTIRGVLIELVWRVERLKRQILERVSYLSASVLMSSSTL